MFKILIDNGVTYLFNDKDDEKINDQTLIGTLINTTGIKEIIESINISKYYLETSKERREITKEQAMFVYSEIIKANNEELNDNKSIYLKK